MSLCVSLFNAGNIHVWADSRVSTEIDGKSYLVTDEFQKIRQIGDKVIFISGDAELGIQVFDAIKPDNSIELIRDIARGYYKEYFKANKDNLAAQEGHGIELGLYIFTLESDIPAFYQMHYGNDFEIDRQEPEDKQIFTVAAHSTEALTFIGKQLRGDGAIDIDKVVSSTYEHLADEIVGGYLHAFLVSKRGIFSSVSRINEKRTYPKWRGRPFRFHLDMKGNLLANSLTANWAKINSSDFSGGKIVGSSINVGNGMFTVDTAGNMYAGNGRFRGEIDGTTFTGGLIRTAASGRRVELDQRGLRAVDASGASRISIQTDSDQGIAGIGFNDSSGSWAAQLIATSDGLNVSAKNGLLLSGGAGRIRFSSKTQFDYGIDITSVDGLAEQLRRLGDNVESLWRALGNKSDKGHSHKVTTANHNHGNPQNQTSGGGTFTTTADS